MTSIPDEPAGRRRLGPSTVELLHCRAWAPLLPLPELTVGSVNGVPLMREAFQRYHDESDVPKYADLCIPCPPRVERRARRSAMRATIDAELLRQRAQTLGVEYDAEQFALCERLAALGGGLGRQGRSRRERVIAQLRFAAIRRAEGLRPPSDADLAAGIRWMFEELGPPPGIALAEIVVTDLDEAHRLRALASAPGADFAELARQHSCSPTAMVGGSLGVLCARSGEGHQARALAVGEIGPPTKFSTRELGSCWRIPESSPHL